jgi:hypothetical protein
MGTLYMNCKIGGKDFLRGKIPDKIYGYDLGSELGSDQVKERSGWNG